MPTHRQLFLNHVGQTSSMPLMLEIDHAEGMFMYTTEGDRYYDMNSGISVSSLGHCHPAVVNAVKDQVSKHMHTMVYGEHIHQPQVKFAELLTNQLREELDCVYYVMTGTEAVEVAMKLARRHKRRQTIIACKNAYHGSTYGSESLRSDTKYKMHFAPGVPGVSHINFNSIADLEKITEDCAAVIFEFVQAEAGVILPDMEFLQKLRERCLETGTMLIADEIQTGFGRTGQLFAHQKYEIIPDVLLIAKSMGGGMPIGAVVANKDILGSFTKEPALGHISTFGGHPVSCAAAYANLSTLIKTDLIKQVEQKSEKIKSLLQHPIVKEIRSSGLLMAVELTKRKYLKHVIQSCFEQKLIVDYFLFNQKSFRLAPPLIINDEEIEESCSILRNAFDIAMYKYE